jgi:hypothetical protein
MGYLYIIVIRVSLFIGRENTRKKIKSPGWVMENNLSTGKRFP